MDSKNDWFHYLKSRAHCAKAIAACKMYLRLPIENPEQERKILKRFTRNNSHLEFNELMNVNFKVSKNIQTLWLEYWLAQKFNPAKVLYNSVGRLGLKYDPSVFHEPFSKKRHKVTAEIYLRALQRLIFLIDETLFELFIKQKQIPKELGAYVEHLEKDIEKGILSVL